MAIRRVNAPRLARKISLCEIEHNERVQSTIAHPMARHVCRGKRGFCEVFGRIERVFFDRPFDFNQSRIAAILNARLNARRNAQHIMSNAVGSEARKDTNSAIDTRRTH